MSSHGLEAR